MRNVIRLLGVLLLVTGCDRPTENEALSLKLERQLRSCLDASGGYSVLRLDTLADFAWDRLYIISDDSGFEQDEVISQAIGFHWAGPPIPNQATRLLFVRQKQVAAYVDCREWDQVDAGGLATRAALPLQVIPSCDTLFTNKFVKVAGLPRAQAVFAIYPGCGLPRAQFIMGPLACLTKHRTLLAKDCSALSAGIANQKQHMDSLLHR